MKISLIGYGRMGQAVEKIAKINCDDIVSVSDTARPLSPEKLKNAQVAIDFSSPSLVLHHIEMASSHHIPIVIGTTGWNQDLEKAKSIIEKAKGAALFAPNFSIGVALFMELLKKTKDLFGGLTDFEMAGIEYHHSAKKDAPSGTAKAMVSLFDGKLPMASVRVGSLFGIHTLLADSPFETISLTHEAKNRDGFAKGALLAAKWLVDKKGWHSFDEAVQSLLDKKG